jgi:iron-sulfur cluster repair protein YtfE (RIC family)
MLIKIGSSSPAADVVDLLMECHERIRSFIALAGRLARADQPSDDEVREAAARVTRYFSEALPLHVADEEQSIVPRLSGRAPELDASLQRMQREHREHEPQLEALLETCRILQASPERLPELRGALLSTAITLEREFLNHLQQEEQIILPAIRNILTTDDRDAILRELRARR